MTKIDVDKLTDKEFYDAYLRTIEEKRAYDREYMRKRRKELRFKIFQILGEKCLMCGSTKHLEIHHKMSLGIEGEGGIKEREEGWILKHIEDCELLCKKCHTRLHKTFGKLRGVKYGRPRKKS